MADAKISGLTELTTTATDDELVIVDKSDTTQAVTGTTKKITADNAISKTINIATAKTTPVDADLVGLVDSAASNVLKKLTWANLKATLKTYFDSVTTTLTNKTLTSPVLTTPSVTGALSVAGEITQTGTADHITITPGTSKLVRLAVLRQDNTTNSYVNNSVILTGWGWTIGNGTGETTEKTVTFGVTFSSLPLVLTGSVGFKDTTDPADISQLAKAAVFNIGMGDITTTNFKIGARHVTDAATIASTRRIGHSWIAIGVL